jgi:hypothetical protein
MIEGVRISSNLEEIDFNALQAFLSRSDGTRNLLQERNSCMR